MKINDQYPSNYLKAADLGGRAVRVTLESVSVEKIGDDKKPVLHFVGKEKGLVLNKTNSNRIIEAVGSDETDDWEGWSVVLYPTKVDFQGKRVDAIRIDDRPGSSQAPKSRVVRGARRPDPVESDNFEPGEDPDRELIGEDIPF